MTDADRTIDNTAEQQGGGSAAGTLPRPASSQEETGQILYDADAPQRYHLRTRGKGKFANKFYDIYITWKPIPEGTYIAYDKQRDVRYASDGQGAIDASNEVYTANVWFGRQIIAKVEGWGKEDGSDLADERLASALEDTVLASEIQASAEALPGDAEEDQPWAEESDSEATQTHFLRCLFNGVLMITEHDLKASDNTQQKRFQRLMSKTKLVEGVNVGRRETKLPSRDEQFGHLYDELLVAVRKYKGRVPLWHKRDVVIAHFTVEQEVLRKNS